MQSATLSALLCLGLLILALTCMLMRGGLQEAALAGTLACVAPPVLLREFARRAAFAQFALARVLVADVMTSLLQSGSLIWLAFSGRLSAIAALWVVAAWSAVTGSLWLYTRRADFVVCWRQLPAATAESLRLGAWLFITQLTVSVQAAAACWTLAVAGGPTASGIYAATMSIALISNPFVIGLGNILAPRYAATLTQSGITTLQRQIVHDMLLLTTGMAVFSAATLFWGDAMLRLLFRNADYQGQQYVVTVQALALLASAAGMPASKALAALERPRSLFLGASFGMLVTIGLTAGLAVRWSVLGAAYAFLLGNAVGAGARWFCVLWVAASRSCTAVPGAVPEAERCAVRQVLCGLPGRRSHADWDVRALGGGGQACLYLAREDAAAGHSASQQLVVKLFHDRVPHAWLDACGQFASLARLRTELDGLTLNGWTLCCPEPIALRRQPLALVMTEVPGQPLWYHFHRRRTLPAAECSSLAIALAAAMSRCWRLGHGYGELNFDNVLCVPDRHVLVLLDAGETANTRSTHGPQLCWPSASRDLGYFLYEAAVSFRHADGFRRRQAFLAEVLRAALPFSGDAGAQSLFLAEIRRCACIHTQAIVGGASLHGIWRILVRLMAYREIERICGQLPGGVRR
jgi:hypothetical protein